MSSKTLISNWQAIVLILLTNIPNSVFFIPGTALSIVNQDAWIAVALAAFIAGLFLFYPLADMGMRYPGKTIIQYSENILGKFLSKIFALLFIYYLFQGHCWNLRIFSEVAIVFLPETPLIVFMIMISFLTVYAVNYGLEVIGRCAVLFFPIGIFSMIFIVLLNIGNMEFSNILPVMESGILPILRASLFPLDFMAMGFVFGVITSFVNNPTDLKKIGLTIIGIGGILLTIFSLVNIMAIGVPNLKATAFPLLTLARYATPPVFERIEILIIALWMTWIFVRAAIYSFAIVLSISQLLNLTDYRFLILTETVLAIAYSIYQYDSFNEMSNLFNIGILFYHSFTIGLPFTLWIVSLVRYKLR